MSAAITVASPLVPGAVLRALTTGLGRLLDIILHIGAHRTGSTSFQKALRGNRAALDAAGIAFWGPFRTRGKLFAGLIPPRNADVEDARQAGRAARRVAARSRAIRGRGMRALLVSDENMAGSVRRNLRKGQLYPGIGGRVLRYALAFDRPVSRIVLNIRALDQFWASSVAYGVWRGHAVPDAGQLEHIATRARGWRGVITELAHALPDTEIRVVPFGPLRTDPAHLLAQAAGLEAALIGPHGWYNAAPDLASLRAHLAAKGRDISALPPHDGLWQPFSKPQRAALRETYQDDLFWLEAGADGLAQLAHDRHTDQPKTEAKGTKARPATPLTKTPKDPSGGHHDEPRYRLDKTG